VGNTEYTAVLAPVSPLGGGPSTPDQLACNIGTAMLWRAEFRIPPGHAGYTGIALVDSGQYILPYSQSEPAWLVGDDDDLSYPYGKQVGDNLALWSYNTSSDYDHGWQVRLVYTPVAAVDVDEAVIITPDVADWLAEALPAQA
jgi:hypothetical protein